MLVKAPYLDYTWKRKFRKTDRMRMRRKMFQQKLDNVVNNALLKKEKWTTFKIDYIFIPDWLYKRLRVSGDTL